MAVVWGKRRIRGAAWIAPLLALFIANCSSTSPYPVAPSKVALRALGLTDDEAAELRPGSPVALGFCYNNQINTPDDVLAEARLACTEGDVSYFGSDILWTPCSVFQPARATFICTPMPKSDEPAVQ